MPNTALVNFAAGETSPRSRGRFDLDWFRASAEAVLNYIPEVPGPARFRPGFKVIAQTRGGVEARQIPFVINSSRKYMLLFTPGKMRVIKNDVLLTKTPYNLLTATDTLDTFADGNYTANPVWTPYLAAGVAVTANRLVCTVPVGNEGEGATTPQTRNIGVFQFDVEISSAGEVAFFATTYVPTVNANGITSYTATGYCVRRTAAGNYKFGRLSGSGTFTELLDLGITGAGLKQFKFIRNSVGVWECYGGTVGSMSLIGTVTDNTYTTCTLFAVQATTASGNTLTIDNILIPGAGATDNQGVITGLTQASPAVVTVAAVGDLANGDECVIDEIVGMLEMNGRQVKLANNAGATFQLTDPVTGAAIASTSFAAYSSGGRLREVYEIDTPYYANDLADLSWAPSARDGLIYIAHPKYALRKITVDSADNFTINTYARTNDPFVNNPQTLQITGIDRAASGTLVYFTTGSVLDPNATYTFASVGGTTELNGGTYRLRIPSGTFPTPRGYLVTTTGEAEVDSSAWTAYTSGGTATPDDEHPIAVAMYESRFCVLGTSVRVNSVFASRAPDDSGNPRYDDFTGGTDADHACFFALAPVNGQIDSAAWLRGTAKYLFAGTFGGPFRLSGSGLDEPITPDSINVRQFDDFGCEAVTPATAGGRVFWIQRGGRALLTARYDSAKDDLAAYDLLLNAEHIAADSRLKRVVFQAGRPGVVWVTREDGILAGMTVQGEENVAGWHRQKIGGTSAKVLDAQPLPRSDKDDQLYVVTERVVNGTTRRFHEVLTDVPVFPEKHEFYTGKDNQTTDETAWKNVVYRRQEEYIHLDCAGTYDGSDRGVTASATLTPSAVSGSGVTLTASAAVFTAADVGKEIWKKPNRSTGAGSGKALITAFTDSTHVTVTVNSDVPFNSTDAIAAGDWYFAVQTIYGLAHLDGATVKVVADGALFDDETVALGKISLDEFAAVVHVGLGYEGFLKTHNLELPARDGGPAGAKPRVVSEARVRFIDSLGTDFGTGLYRGEELEWRRHGDNLNRPPPVFSGVRPIPVRDEYSREERDDGKHIIFKQRVPLPCTIAGIDIVYETTGEA